jgi:starch synthase
MRILFVASEGLPFSKTGGLADVIEALPKALVELGHEVAVVLPRYRGTDATIYVAPSVTIPMGKSLRFPNVADGRRVGGVRYFFADDPEYFDRDQLYGEGGKDYPDSAQRYCEFSRVAIEIAKRIWRPDIIHCHDWQAALVPVLLKTQYEPDPLLKNVASVFTIHNMGYHGLFPRTVVEELDLPPTLFRMEAMEFFGKVNFLKGGLVFADYLTTVSPRYAEEIQTKEYGAGLEGVIANRKANLRGILNGVDYSIWSPEKDTYIASHYSARDLSGKKVCKKDLLTQVRLDATDLERPVIGIVSRFAAQKGFDLIEKISSEMLKENVAIVALGSGEPRYEALFTDLAKKYPRQVAVRVAFDNALAHKIEAGSDIFLMPSRYEPCGLNQIYSLRYGTVPVVRATGGLDDTIDQWNPVLGTGTGFKFADYDAVELLANVRSALEAYRDQKSWKKLQRNGMGRDFSWRTSAEAYANLYETARQSRNLPGSTSSNSVVKVTVTASAKSRGKGVHGR